MVSSPGSPASTAMALLERAGLDVRAVGGTDLVVRDGVTEERVRLKVRRRTIYAYDALRLLETAPGRVLVVVPRASKGLLETASSQPRLGVVSLEDEHLLWDGEQLLPEVDPAESNQAAPPEVVTRRPPWGRWALMRVLLKPGSPRSQTVLAGEAGISQPAVSKALSSLGSLVTRGSAGWSARDRVALLDRFLTDYPGPGGISTFWLGFDPVTGQAQQAVATAEAQGVRLLLSGDAAADVLSPWRRPTRALGYAARGVELTPAKLASSTPEGATLEYRVPADPTVWSTAAAWADRTSPTTVDPVLVAWDLLHGNGNDTHEAARKLIDRVIL